MSEQIIDAYIEYLRNVSRKIISKSGFEYIFPDITKKRNHYYTNFENYKDEFVENDIIKISYDDRSFYRRLKSIYDFLQIENDHRLFIGSGILIGTIKGNRKNYSICAPLLYSPLDLDFEDRHFEIIFDKDNVQLNQDLITKIFDLIIDEEFDSEFGYNNDYISKFANIETIENKFSDQYGILINNSKELIQDLIINCPDFRNVEVSEDYFDLNILNNEEIFESEKIRYYNHAYLFVNRVPHELSTYEALNTLRKNKPLNNELLEKLFQNILTNKKVDLKTGNEIQENKILEIIEKFIPLTLSDNQKSAIQKAWTSEISYIQGPPGTGKSYTIAALILSAIFLNKKILLVSHKEAAINIVKNMIDDMLGKESLLYIGSLNGQKKRTKEYFEEIIKFAQSSNYLFSNKFKKLEYEVDRIKNEINRIYERYKETLENTKEILNAENEFYKLHEEFLKKRGIFKNNFSIKDIDKYKWKSKIKNSKNYFKAIEKYKKRIRKISKSRVDILYLTKFIKHFIKEFKFDLDKIKTNPVYTEELFQIHNLFSETKRILNRIEHNELSGLRNNLNLLQEELFFHLKKFLPLYWKYAITEKLVGDENKWLRDEIDAYKRMLHFKRTNILVERMQNINYKDILDVFPLWCSELRDLGKSIILQNEIFDLVIIDEASQVNIAEIIPAFYRGKKFCVVGDKKQLNLNATGVGFALSNTFDKLSWQESMVKYEGVISYEAAKERNLIVTHSSILDFISSETNNFAISTSMLDEHFRSLPPLASFTSKNFYEDKWKIMTENGENVAKICWKPIEVGGYRDSNKRLVQTEINKIDEMLNQIRYGQNHEDLKIFDNIHNNENYTYGIICFLTNQVQEIRKLIDDKYSDVQKRHNIFVATPEEFQGNERDVMIISLGLDNRSRWGKGFYENPNRFNVATSRAKYFTYVVYAGLPENIDLIGKYFSAFGYVQQEKPRQQTVTNNLGWKLNLNNCESDFELKVYEYLNKYRNEKNEHVEIFNQVTACGQKRLDFVLYDSIRNLTCAVEVDGKDHFFDNSYRYNEAHLSRMAVLKRAGWKIINVKYFNWWDNGWLCDMDTHYFANEVSRLYSELDKIFQD